MKKLLWPRIIALTTALLLLLTTGVIYADNDGGARIYKVTITNLTSGQPFTPPLLATHKKSTGLFEVGKASSFELKEIAENGNLGPMLTALDGDSKVHDVVTGGAPLVPDANPGGTPFGSSASFLIKASGSARYLSWASMLICTNDGFTGSDSLRLPGRAGHKVTVMTAGYDGGTEMNTEDFADIVPPCQGLIGVSSADGGTGVSNPALLEDDVIRMHPGILGGDDLLPGIHGWTDPVAMVMVERIPLNFGARLDGSQEVPSVDTETTGRFHMAFNSYLSKAKFDLRVRDGQAITQAHLHCAPAGSNGPVVAFLFGMVPGGFDVDGTLARFTLTDANIAAVGSDCSASIGMDIASVSDLAHAVSMGNIYANVHSVDNPSGEVRGQLSAVNDRGAGDRVTMSESSLYRLRPTPWDR